MRGSQRSSSLVLAAVLSTSVATLPVATAEDVPVGSSHRLAMPTGDVHVDRGMFTSNTLARSSDVTGIDLDWNADGITAALHLNGVPPAGDALPASLTQEWYLVMEDLSAGNEGGVLSMSWDSRWGGAVAHHDDGGGDQAVTECATSELSGTTITFHVPADCLDGVPTTLWVDGSSIWVQQDLDGAAGAALMAGDIALHDAQDALAVLHRPDVAAAAPQEGSSAGDDLGQESSDSDGSASRAVLADPEGDSTADFDVLSLEVTDDAGTLTGTITTTPTGSPPPYVVVELETSGNDPDATDIAVFAYADDVDITYDYVDDWGRRSCDGGTGSSTESSITFTVPAGCAQPGDFVSALADVFVFDNYFNRSRLGDYVHGPVSLTRSGPTTPEPTPDTDRPEATPRDVADTCDGREPQTQFTDIDGNVHEENINCLSSYGITQGKGGGEYGPADNLSRGQIATFLVRTLDVAGWAPPETSGACTGRTHGDNLDRLVAEGIMSSRDCDLSSRVTRTEMAQATHRAMQYAGADPDTTTDWFHDDEAYAQAVQDAHNAIAGAGVVTGRTVGEFAPLSFLSRAQMATFLVRLLDAIA